MFVSVWTDKFLHFGNRTSNRVESQHSKLKSYLNSAQSSLPTFMNKINQVIQSQDTEIKASIQQSRSITKHLHRIPHFQQLCGFVSLYALDIMLQEYHHAQSVGLFSGNCSCLLRTCYGLPCAHEQMLYFNKGLPIPIDSIDVFWTKLDLSACQTLQDDNIGCEDEVRMFTEQFNKQSRAGKFSFLRKITEIFTPSKTSVREPVVNKTTRGRPSLKDKNLRKTHVVPSVAAHVDPSFSAHGDPSFSAYVDPSFSAHVDPSFTAEKPFRRSCSNVSSFVDLNEMSYQEPARHSSFFSNNYNTHPYIDQIPEMFHPYIRNVQDVRGDGNCGFRAIAVHLGLHEDAWPTIRSNLMEELEAYKTEYLNIFGRQYWNIVYNILNFFQSDRGAPVEHWMTMPEIGTLIASRYNVMLHVIDIAGCSTYLPLRSTPPPWYQHVIFAIGYVNGNHYIKLDLAEGYPIPRITQHFRHCSYPCAAAWATPYLGRINKYEQLLRVSATTDNVILE